MEITDFYYYYFFNNRKNGKQFEYFQIWKT